MPTRTVSQAKNLHYCAFDTFKVCIPKSFSLKEGFAPRKCLESWGNALVFVGDNLCVQRENLCEYLWQWLFFIKWLKTIGLLLSMLRSQSPATGSSKLDYDNSNFYVWQELFDAHTEVTMGWLGWYKTSLHSNVVQLATILNLKMYKMHGTPTEPQQTQRYNHFTNSIHIPIENALDATNCEKTVTNWQLCVILR